MISVIMASYLGDYPNAASNREEKLHRAIKSFLIQEIGELIIVADGCEKTAEIAKQYPSVQLVTIPKQSTLSGKTREAGIAIAKYDWICYLDSDDEFKPGHLKVLQDNIDNNVDWFYYDDYTNDVKRISEVCCGKIGTSSICHKKRFNNATWGDGYEHDWHYIKQLGDNYKKIEGAGYIVRHIPGRIDN